MVQTEQARHNKQVRLFNDCNNLEQALCRHLVKAINNSYLTALRNRQTITIDVTIPVIIDYLFSNHGRVTPAMLHHEEKLVREMFYDPTHPIDVIFNKVEDLSDLSVAARADFSEQQLINIAHVIINSTGKYQPYIREWSRLPNDQKTWPHFKTHFRQAHQELKEAGYLQVRDTQFNSANLVQDVIKGMKSALQQPEVEPSPEIIQQLANNASQQQLMPQMMAQMMAQMMQMLQQMSTIQQQLQSNSTSTSITSNSTGSSSRRRRQRTNTLFYCWSHGACAHPSAECNSKRPGHQDTATFTNKMGGSVAYCTLTSDTTTT